MKAYMLILILLSCNPDMAMGIGIVYNFLSSLFNKNNNNSGLGSSIGVPSIPNPIPILDLKLTTNVCGDQVSSCPPTRYRSINGSCNNLEHPGWGTPKSTYSRLLKNNYSDDGQPLMCCKDGKLNPEEANNELCIPVIVGNNDPVYKKGHCLDMVRAETDRNLGCVDKDQVANQVTMVTSYLDSSVIYGSTDEESEMLRAFENGNLKTVTRHGREWPPQAEDATQTCSGVESPKEPCYVGGDTRINQNTELTVLQVLALHFHNYVADTLGQVNPHWDDERIFQESRRIVIAVYQNINYYEFLPYFLGKKYMLANKLIYPITKANKKEYVNDYDPTVVASIINESAAAALRYFHTLIQGTLVKKNEDRSNAGSLRLSDWFNRPVILEKNDTFDELVVGLSAQPSSVADPFMTKEITQYLFRPKTEKLGGDLRATDYQRNNDMGLGTYQAGRGICGLSVPKTWDDLKGIIPAIYIKLLKELYKDVSDISLSVGGTLEIHVPGARAGPTFLCIMIKQFRDSRIGDRFWYENGKDKKIAFTKNQLGSIRDFKMASFFCAASEVGTMQREAFEVVTKDNPVVSCDEIPSLDFSLWKESVKVDDEVDEGYGEQEETNPDGECEAYIN